MSARTVRIRTDEGIEEVRFIAEPAPGLVVVFDDSDGQVPYALVHERTGYTVGEHHNPEALAAFALRLADITDWSADGLTVKAGLGDQVAGKRAAAEIGIGLRFVPWRRDYSDLPTT